MLNKRQKLVNVPGVGGATQVKGAGEGGGGRGGLSQNSGLMHAGVNPREGGGVMEWG